MASGIILNFTGPIFGAGATGLNGVTGVVLPVAPTLVSVAEPANFGTKSLVITWTDNSTDETGFSIERSTDGVSYAEINTPAADATSYTNSGLTAEQIYYYRMRSVRSGVYSVYSNVISATPTQIITWTNLTNVIATGSALQKDGGAVATLDASARSLASIPSGGESFVEFTFAGWPLASEPGDVIRFGITQTATPGVNSANLHKGFYIDTANRWVITDGALSNVSTIPLAGHVFRVEVSTSGNVVKLYDNGVLFHTFGAGLPTYPLYVFIQMYRDTDTDTCASARMGTI